MKVLSVELENLNSLREKVFIDFTAPEFAQQGLFAIVGPTGSGKTTILDAICLALYGRTPRIKNITQSENQILSCGARFCRAEVVFETKNHGTFRCTWSQSKRKRSDGLDKVIHELVHVDTGEIIEKEKTQKVKEEIEKRIGMDFDRFTQSIMLAQGKFTMFLHSSANERAELLEQMTGSDIYRTISKTIFNRNKDEDQKLKLIRAGLEQVTLLSDQERAGIHEEEIRLHEQEETTQNALTEIRGKLQLHERMEEIQTKTTALEEAKTELEKDENQFKPNTERLKAAKSALPVEPAWQTVALHRQQLEKAQKNLDSLEKQYPESDQLLISSRNKEQQATEALAQGEIQYEATKKTITVVRVLDLQIAAAEKDLREKNDRLDEISTDHAKGKKQLENLQKELELGLAGETVDQLQKLCQTEKNTLQTLLDAGSLDTLLNKQQQLGAEIKTREQIVQRLGSLEKDRLELEKLAEKIAQLESQQTTLSAKAKEARDQKKQLDAKLTQLDEQLKQQRTIHDLEPLRKQLQDGQCCPLCGALEHPYAKENIPEQNLTENELKQLKKEMDDLVKEMTTLELKEQHTQEQINSTKKDQEERTKSTSENENALKQELKALNETLTPSIESAKEKIANLQSEIETSNQTIKKISEKQNALTTLEKRCSDAEKAVIRIQAEQDRIKTLDQQMIRLNDEIVTLKKDTNEKSEERARLFGEKQIEQVEKEQEEQIAQLRMLLEQSRTERMKAESNRENLKKQCESARKAMEEQQQVGNNAEKTFLQTAKEKGFQSEKEFLDARMEQTEHDQLEIQFENLKKRRTDWEAQWKQLQTDKESIKLDPSVPGKKELQAQSLQYEESLKELRKQLGVHEQKLKQDDDDRKKRRNILEQESKQQKECNIWSQLNALIGSSNGDAFQKFAQALTFRTLIQQANVHLMKMSNRYMLQSTMPKPPKKKSTPKNKKQETPAPTPQQEETTEELIPTTLDFYIMDAEQGGVVRPINNLSGGETFLVSLALALGLSSMSMAASKDSVDSLFIDEGFGTLDEETLEVALNVLDGLHHQGKIVGIISHVQPIQDRIPLQIKVERLRDGESKVIITGNT